MMSMDEDEVGFYVHICTWMMFSVGERPKQVKPKSGSEERINARWKNPNQNHQ
jgi:hypothetical protein